MTRCLHEVNLSVQRGQAVGKRVNIQAKRGDNAQKARDKGQIAIAVVYHPRLMYRDSPEFFYKAWIG